MQSKARLYAHDEVGGGTGTPAYPLMRWRGQIRAANLTCVRMSGARPSLTTPV